MTDLGQEKYNLENNWTGNLVLFSFDSRTMMTWNSLKLKAYNRCIFYLLWNLINCTKRVKLSSGNIYVAADRATVETSVFNWKDS